MEKVQPQEGGKCCGEFEYKQSRAGEPATRGFPHPGGGRNERSTDPARGGLEDAEGLNVVGERTGVSQGKDAEDGKDGVWGGDGAGDIRDKGGGETEMKLRRGADERGGSSQIGRGLSRVP